MDTIEFIIPTYWEIWDAWSKLDLKLIAILLASFFLGFQIRRFMNRRLLSEMKEDIVYLKTRIEDAEDLLSREPVSVLQEIENPPTSLDSLKDGTPGETKEFGSGMTYTSEEKLVDEDVKLTDSTPLDRSRPRQMVRLTKIVGDVDGGTTDQPPILGFEENPPVEGERYRILKEDGSTLYIPPVTKVTSEYILTDDSVYKIEPLESNQTETIQEKA